MYSYRRFMHGRYNRSGCLYIFLVALGIFFGIFDLYDSIRYQNYISCNSYKECTSYTFDKKTKEKTRVKIFIAEDLKYECELNAAGKLAERTGNFSTRKSRRIYWILNLYSGDKLINSKDKYSRRTICEKDGKKYIDLIRTQRAPFKL